MKRWINTAAALLVLFILPLKSYAAQLLVPVGEVIGLQLRTDSVTVAAFDDLLGAGARDAGLKIGDEIIMVDECPVHSARDVTDAIREKSTAVLTVRRGCKKTEITVPLSTGQQGTKLGVYLRQGISGIGTVTWYDPETGAFGALGHGVSDSSGAILHMTEGHAYAASVESVRPGKTGNPGQLRGSADAAGQCARILRNTPQGVFGIAFHPWEGEALPAAAYEEIRTGNAWIRSTVEGDSPRDYSVEILKIYPRERPDCRNFLLKVTDPTLLNTTGGIVQGMSGSPIIQDGKLIGAVTHVLVNDPTTGYGIFVENMLDAAA